MPTDTKLNNLVINYLTQAQYDSTTPNENELYLTPDDSATDLGASATNLHLLSEGKKIGSGINLSGFEYDEATKTLKASGGGGGSSTPTLLDLMGNAGVRATITEEEKTNLDNGYYDRISYYPDEQSGIDVYAPAKVVDTTFSQFHINAETATVDSLGFFAINIGDKNAEGLYPITIENIGDFKIGGGSTSSSSFEEATLSQLSGFKGQYKALHITDCNVVFNFQEIGEITSNSVYFVGFVNSETQLEGTVWTIFGSNPVCLCTGTFYITNGVINGGHCTIGSLNSVSVGSLFTSGGTRSFNSKDATNAIGLYGVQGCEYAGKVDFVSNGATASKSALTIISNVNKEATGESTFCEMTGLFDEYGLGRMVLKKDANNVPQFKSFTTWFPPVTGNSEGKALIVTEGNAKWTNIPRYKHVVNLSFKEAGVTKLSALFTGYNSSNEPVTTYEKLTKLFGGETLELHGKVVVDGTSRDTKYLDLHGGGINTDNIAYYTGTGDDPLALVAINLDQFDGLTISDDWCLPK